MNASGLNYFVDGTEIWSIVIKSDLQHRYHFFRMAVNIFDGDV